MRGPMGLLLCLSPTGFGGALGCWFFGHSEEN
jgi:hypothetical protein